MFGSRAETGALCCGVVFVFWRSHIEETPRCGAAWEKLPVVLHLLKEGAAVASGEVIARHAQGGKAAGDLGVAVVNAVHSEVL